MGRRVRPGAGPQVIVETGKAVGSEGLVAGQVVDIKSEGQAETVASTSPSPPSLLCGPCTSQVLARSDLNSTRRSRPSCTTGITRS